MARQVGNKIFLGDRGPKLDSLTWLNRVDDRFMGAPVEIDHLTVLQRSLEITWGEVVYCDKQVSKLRASELFERPASTFEARLPSGRVTLVEESRDPEVLSRWVQLRDSAIERANKIAKLLADIGFDTERLKLAEAQAALMTRYFDAVLGDLELTPEQFAQVGPAMRRNLHLVRPPGENVA